ncbi:MAG: hypothetical protein ACOY0T_23585 [Myxococcota bacterium]
MSDVALAALRPGRVPLLLALCAAACRKQPSAEELAITRTRAVNVPANDPSGLCSDIADARVCWSAKRGEEVWVGERRLPGPGASDLGKYRCTGSGAARECRLRSDLAPAFRCRGSRCIQPQPRVPDDGEWECADLGGVVLCRGGAVPAGVARPSSDPGWRCGARNRSTLGERVCLDLDPDYPRGRSKSFTCGYEMDGAALTRVCEASELPVLGSRCQGANMCPADARCVGGICLPEAFSPNCWGDLDCAPHRCVYGACIVRHR